jgi:anti-anti-sigma regulatory factor
MQINVAQTDGMAAVKIEGDLRLGTVAEAKPALIAALATGSEIQLDLGAMRDCDTAGIQLLLMTCASARAKGTKLTTISHTVSFQAALGRIGIPGDGFDFQTTARDDTQDDHQHR